MAPARSKKTATKPAKKTSGTKTATKQPAKKSATKRAAAKSPPAKKSRPKAAPRKRAQNSPADAVDEQLARYRSMRDFHVTAEPSGADARAKKSATARTADPAHGLPFVHPEARRLAPALRLPPRLERRPEILGRRQRPQLRPRRPPPRRPGRRPPHGVRRLRRHHPQRPVRRRHRHGLGPGHLAPAARLRRRQRSASAKARSNSSWTAPRCTASGRSSAWAHSSTSSSGSRWGSSDKPNWLLIKEHDDFERGPNDPAITDAEPNSAVTGRTMDQIAHESDHVWNSKETAGTGTRLVPQRRSTRPERLLIRTEASAASQT